MLFSVFLVFAYVVTYFTGRVLGKMKMLHKNIQYNIGNKAFSIKSKIF